jgi:tetratricopeptide (TPR) repeat protein
MRRLRPVIAFICAASALMCVRVVQAQSDDNTQRAVILFEESETAYNEGRFEEAAAMLRRAYDLHPDPTLLFNLARAEEGMGDLTGAIDTYERYITAAPDAPDAGAIRARIETLRRQREQLSNAATPTEEPEVVEEESETPVADDGPGIDPLPWIVAGGGAAVAGIGIVFGVLSQSKASESVGEPVQATAFDLHSQASTFATLANVFIIAGSVIAVGGVVWGVLGLTMGGDDEESVAATVVPGGVVVRGRF